MPLMSNKMAKRRTLGGVLDIRLDYQAIAYFVILTPLILTGYVDVDSNLSKIKSQLTLLSYALVALLFLAARHRRPDCSTGLTFVLLADLTVTTLAFQGISNTYITYIAPIIAILLLWITIDRNNQQAMLAALNALSIALIYLNALSLLLFPSGMYSTVGTLSASADVALFLGHNNAVARTTVPLLLFGIIYNFKRYGKMTLGITVRTVVVFGTALYSESGSGVLGTLPILLAVLMWRFVKNRRINVLFLFASSIILWVLIMFAQSGPIEYVITNVFQKDPTLTGRTLIWERVFEYVKDSPLFGYGYSRNYELSNGFLLSSTGQSAHNYYLDLLLRGGIIQLAIQLLIILAAMRANETKIRNSSWGLANIVAVGLSSYFLMWLIEPFVGSGMVLMISFFTYICRYEDSGKEESSGRYVPVPECFF